MNTPAVRKSLPYMGFACLLVGMFGSFGLMPAPLEIGVLALAVLSFAGVLALYLRSKQKVNRVPRSTFWIFIGALFAVTLFTTQLMFALPQAWGDKRSLIIAVSNLLVIIVGVVVQVRRLHDINNSGWWILINAIPYLGLAATIIACGFIPGTRGPNRFGPDPLGRAPRPSPSPAVTPGDRAAITVARDLDQYDEQRTPKSSPPVPAPAAARPAIVSSMENELRSLAALNADGIISEQEFSAKKRALLGL